MKRSSSSSSSAPPSSSKTVPSKASYPFIVSGSTARIIHTLLPLTIVVIGILACPEGPEAYIRAFLTLFLAIAGTILSSAWIAEFAYEYIFCCRRLQADKTESSKMRYQEGWETTRASWMFASLAAFVRTRYLAGKPTAIVFTLAEAQPEAPDALWLYIVKLILVTLLVDFYMYFKHRLLHWRPLFAFHRDHHTFHNPSPFASFAVAPVEAFLTFSPVLLLCFPQLPILAQAYGLWVTGFVWLNLYLHAGFVGKFSETVLRSIGLNSSSFHNIHHEKTIQNFGELMYIWDTILATGAHPVSTTHG